MNVKLKALSTHRKFLGLRHPGFLEPFWSSPCACQGFLTVQGECILLLLLLFKIGHKCGCEHKRLSVSLC